MEEKKAKILTFFKDLEFNEKYHKYYVKGKELPISVSGIINNFKKEFDTERISKRVSINTGVPQEEIKRRWETTSKKALKKGTEVHLFGELYPFNKHLKPRNGYEQAIVNFWNDVPEHIIPVIMELEMYHKKYMFGGTADILLYDTKNNDFIIGDYKTNKDLFKNYKGQKMLKQFSKCLDNSFNAYQIQLSLYQILFQQTGLKVSSRKLIWLKSDSEYEMYDLDNHTEVLSKYLETDFNEKS